MTSEDSLYDHYKDTFDILKSYMSKRDHYTIALLGMVVVSCLKITNPHLLNEYLSKFIDTKISGLTIAWSYLSVFVSYLFLWIVMQYYQNCLTIEKTYDYLHKIEDELSSDGSYRVRREGHNYLNCYPWFKWFTHRIYVLFIPMLVSFLAIVNIVGEIWTNTLCLHSISGILILLADCLVVILSLLYLSNRWLHEEAFSKDMFPNMSRGQRIISYFGFRKLPNSSNQ